MTTTLTNEVYHEEIPFLVAKIVAIFMGVLSIIFLILLLIQISGTPIGDNPPPDWMYLILIAVFLGATWLVYNLKVLTISINESLIKVAYGRISYSITFENIETATIDTNPGILYGGWGIRLAKIGGESALIYNVISKPRVILKLRSGRFKQFAFSTKQPEEIIQLINPSSKIKSR